MSKLDEITRNVKSLYTPLVELIVTENMRGDKEFAEQAAAELAALRARVEELEAVVRKAAAHVIATHNGITPYQTDEEMVNELGAAALDKAGTK